MVITERIEISQHTLNVNGYVPVDAHKVQSSQMP